jgi:hypothetical protein
MFNIFFQGLGTDEKTILEILLTSDNNEIEERKEEYKKRKCITTLCCVLKSPISRCLSYLEGKYIECRNE